MYFISLISLLWFLTALPELFKIHFSFHQVTIIIKTFFNINLFNELFFLNIGSTPIRIFRIFFAYLILWLVFSFSFHTKKLAPKASFLLSPSLFESSWISDEENKKNQFLVTESGIVFVYLFWLAFLSRSPQSIKFPDLEKDFITRDLFKRFHLQRRVKWNCQKLRWCASCASQFFFYWKCFGMENPKRKSCCFGCSSVCISLESFPRYFQHAMAW